MSKLRAEASQWISDAAVGAARAGDAHSSKILKSIVKDLESIDQMLYEIRLAYRQMCIAKTEATQPGKILHALIMRHGNGEFFT